MPALVHLSDIHFGSPHHAYLDEAVLRDIAALNPAAVIVSGDLTMRARHCEFEQARAFLARITQPILTIPGNHDQPILTPRDWLERLTRQYARYQYYIHPTIDSTLEVGGLFILGLNDNHPLLPGGFWSRTQRAWLDAQLARAPQGATKMVVTHHQLVWNGWRPAGFWNAERTLQWLAARGVELVLNGHTHIADAVQTSQGIVVVRAGTATSGRTRHGFGNAYNFLTLDAQNIHVQVRRYDAAANAFVVEKTVTFTRHVSR